VKVPKSESSTTKNTTTLYKVTCSSFIFSAVSHTTTMTSLQNSPTLHRTLLHNSFSQVIQNHTLLCFNFANFVLFNLLNVGLFQKLPTSRSPRRDAVSFTVKAAQEPSASLTPQGSFFFPLGLLRLNSWIPLSYDKNVIGYL